jgi:hypothetical protein
LPTEPSVTSPLNSGRLGDLQPDYFHCPLHSLDRTGQQVLGF